jgi:uridine phosphorylase
VVEHTLSALYTQCLREQVGASGLGKGFTVRTGMDATADSFYSSQGRKGGAFMDKNDALLSQLSRAHPALATLQMETFHLLDLARAAHPSQPVHAAAAAIVLVNRSSTSVVSKEELHALEVAGGRAALDTLAAFTMQDGPGAGVEGRGWA